MAVRRGTEALKLTYKDYIENSLGELLEQGRAYDQINIDVFNDLQHTITGWPGGKPNADDSTRPVSSEPFPKRVVVFSPTPTTTSSRWAVPLSASCSRDTTYT